MPTSLSPTEQLATLKVLPAAWPEEPDEADAPGDWIQRGIAYAEGIRLWRSQLSTAIASLGTDRDRLEDALQNIERQAAWDQSVIHFLLSDLQGGSSPYQRAQAADKLVNANGRTTAQRLGAGLELARVGHLLFGINAIKQILEAEQASGKECLELCALLVCNLPAEATIQGWDRVGDYEYWKKNVALHLEATSMLLTAVNFACGEEERTTLVRQQEKLLAIETDSTQPALQRWESVRFKVSEAFLQGDSQAAQALVHDWLTGPCGMLPHGLDKHTYAELLLNACSIGDKRQPQLWLVESRSLPRSGHHFVKSLLEKAWGDDFSYCERYQEPGCCKASPCSMAAYWHFAREHKRSHLRLLKSHDFALADAIFPPPPGMIRLIQVRRPFHLLVSWLELIQLEQNREILQTNSIAVERIALYHEPELLEDAWRLLDQAGTVMTAEQVQEWLNSKVHYIIGFLQKWLPNAQTITPSDHIQSGNVLVRYEELGQLQHWLQALRRDGLNAEQLPIFSPRHHHVIKRQSTRVTNLIRTHLETLKKAEAQVMEEVPAMQVLYPQPLNH